jgi:hypothetical protein
LRDPCSFPADVTFRGVTQTFPFELKSGTAMNRATLNLK